MTETQDQLDVLPRIGSDAPESRSPDASESQQRARRRSGSLATMLLPELQALAGSLGIASAKVRKSDLVAAIQNAQQTVAPPQKPAPDVKASTRTRRSATRSAGSTQPETTKPDTTKPESTKPESSTNVDAASSANGVPADGAAVVPDVLSDQPVDRTQADRTQVVRTQADRTQVDQTQADRTQADRTQADRTQADRTLPDRTNADRTNADRTNAEGSNADRTNTDRSNAGRSSADRSSADRGDRPERNRSAQRDRGDNQRNGNQRSGNNQANNSNSQTVDRGNQAGNGNSQAVDRNQGSNQNSNGSNQTSNGSNQNSNGSNQNSNGNAQAVDRSNQANNGNTQAGNGNTQANDRNLAGDSDDDDFGNRRPRRYRDRRGRLRERFDAAPGGVRNDAEPAVTDDDVLIPVAGILDNVDDKNNWFIRVSGYFASPEDVFVATTYIRRYGLRRGDAVTGVIKQPRDGERKEKFSPLVRMDTVNGLDPELAKNRVEFTKLTPLYPQDRLRLETESHILTTRVIDLVMPIGKGQRALVVSPPKAGKTMVLQSIANAIAVNNPECHLMVVLVDERPEEVTDMQRSVKGEVIASTFDRRPQDHIVVAELSIERAKRLVEMGHDVVVLLDSITRLGRAYNLGAPASGRILSGGVDSAALYPPKRFLGAARNIEDGGSLTIIATALVETGSAGDTVIFEEFKGTGNAELKLDRKIADKRIFPAIDVDQSSTRKEEILLSPEELAVVIKLRRVLHALDTQQGIDLLLDRLRKTRTNIEFLMQIAKTSSGADDR